MQLDAYQRSAAGPMLVLTAVDLMTRLYESSVSRQGLSADVALATPTSVGSTDAESRFPCLLLGNFKADPEEAAAIWRHALFGELRHILRLLDMLSSHRHDAQFSQSCLRASSGYLNLCGDLERRIKSLVTSLEGQR